MEFHCTLSHILTKVLTPWIMASVWKHPKSRYWTACYTDTDGRQRKRSTKSTNKHYALKMARELEAAYRRKITEEQARALINEVYEEINGSSLVKTTLREYTDRLLAAKEHEVARGTYAKYVTNWNEFCEYLGECSRWEIARISPRMIAEFRDFLIQGVSPATVNHKLKTIRVLFEQAWKDSLITENPAKKVPLLRNRPPTARREFSVDELKALLRHADEEWYGMILCGVYTGQRLGDIGALSWNNVDLAEGEIRLQTVKTGRTQVIPLASPLRKYLEDRVGDNPKAPLFPRAHEICEREGRTGTLSNQFYELLTQSGLVTPRPKEHTRQKNGRSGRRQVNELSFHSLRHTATSMLKNAGVSEAVARDIIGHDSAAVSRQYTHIDSASKKAALEKMPDLVLS